MLKTGLLILSGLAMTAAGQRQTGFLDRALRIGSNAHRYQVFVPSSWDGRTKLPVILFLHGAGERGDDGLLQTDVGLGRAIREHVERWPFLVVMPQCSKEKTWLDGDMEALALGALDAALAEFGGDPERVVVSGMSMGGYATWALAAKHPGRFAALAPICGGLRPPKRFRALQVPIDPGIADPYAEVARRLGKTPIWLFHGSADPLVPVEESRKMAAALQAAGADVRYTEYPGVGHDSWTPAYAEPELAEWMARRSLRRERR